jgi:hypothetical protein
VLWILQAAAQAPISDSEWTALGVIIVAVFGFFGVLVKLILQMRSDNKELQDKIMDRAIPALEANAKASEVMVTVAQQVLTALAVQQAVKDDRQEQARHRREDGV